MASNTKALTANDAAGPAEKLEAANGAAGQAEKLEADRAKANNGAKSAEKADAENIVDFESEQDMDDKTSGDQPYDSEVLKLAATFRKAYPLAARDADILRVIMAHLPVHLLIKTLTKIHSQGEILPTRQDVKRWKADREADLKLEREQKTKTS